MKKFFSVLGLGLLIMVITLAFLVGLVWLVHIALVPTLLTIIFAWCIFMAWAILDDLGQKKWSK